MERRLAEVIISPIGGACIGLLLGSGWLIAGILAGWGLESTIFAFTLAVVYVALRLRTLVGLLALLGLGAIALSGFVGWRAHGRPDAAVVRWVSAFAIALLLPCSLTFLILDPTVFLGAFPSVAFVLGSLLLAAAAAHALAHPAGLGRRSGARIERAQLPGLVSLAATVLLAAVLVLPSIAPVSGLLPAPPGRPGEGYGSGEMPYEVASHSRSVTHSPSVAEWWPEAAAARDWKVHLFLPVDHGQASLGVAVLLHGFEGEDVAYYEDTLTSLAGYGLIAIFPEYVSSVDYSSVSEDFEFERSEGGTNDPAHLPRYSMALAGVDAAIDLLANDPVITAALEGASVDGDHLWIGGHSMGAGTTLHVTSELIGRGWGGGSLVIDLEAPWIGASQPALRGDMGRLPDHAQIQVVEYGSDEVVAECLGRWHHDRMLSRDGTTALPASQVRLLQIPSDRHGYPDLIASHYAQVTLLRDPLADRAYYPRIEAQADHVASMARGDAAAAESARAAFMDAGGAALQSGSWSDGTPVEPMAFHPTPMDDTAVDWTQCESE